MNAIIFLKIEKNGNGNAVSLRSEAQTNRHWITNNVATFFAVIFLFCSFI